MQVSGRFRAPLAIGARLTRPDRFHRDRADIRHEPVGLALSPAEDPLFWGDEVCRRAGLHESLLRAAALAHPTWTTRPCSSLGPQVVVDPLTQYAEPAPTLLADPGWARTCTRIGSSAAAATVGSAITWRSCTRHISQLTAITVRCPKGSYATERGDQAL